LLEIFTVNILSVVLIILPSSVAHIINHFLAYNTYIMRILKECCFSI